ncbi:hypothetical protein SRHO_G00117080 [Serrasalmus rhombeus]
MNCEKKRLSSSNWRYRRREEHSELQTPAEKMEMKMSCVCLVLGLVLLMTVSSDAAPLVFGHPNLCCFIFATLKIPDEEIQEVVKTHPNCPKPGYVVVANKGKFCKEEVVLK